MKFFIVGAGYTGERVVSRLPENSTTTFRRSVPTSGPTISISLDLDKDCRRLPVTVPEHYCVLYTVPPHPETDPDPRLGRLLQLLDPLPARIVYLSTSGVYGDCDGGLVNEDATPRPVTRRATARLHAEQHLQLWCDENGVRCLILRVPAIYGPGRLGMERILSGKCIIAEAEANPGNRIHVDDLVNCCVGALTRELPSGTFNVGDGDYRSPSWFSLAVARLAKIPPPRQITMSDAQQSMRTRRLSYLDQSRRLDNAKMLLQLVDGLQYADPLDGIRASL